MPTDQTIDFVVMFLVIGLLALGLGSWLLGWLAGKWQSLMSRSAGAAVSAGRFDADDRPVSPAETNSETDETLQHKAETNREMFTFGETEALARLIVANRIGLTDAVKIGANAKSGEKYQRRSREIKAAVERLQNKYPRMTPEQQAARQAIGLE